MKPNYKFFIVSLLMIAVFFFSCAGPKRLTTDQTYLNLKPVEPLPIYDLENLPVNFEVTIENVADMASSYKNRANLYINNHIILPDEEISNVQDTYHYKLKLQPGIYKVRGEYYALDGFTEKKYEINPQTKVMVKPETLTKLQYEIKKNWDGTPLHKQMIFNVSYEPLATQKEKAVERPSINTKMNEKTSAVNQSKNRDNKMLQKQPIPKNRHLIVLQVNTAPSGADVIVDDKYMGQSPIRILVDRNTDHILQMSLENHQEVIKYLDKNQFGNDKIIHFLQKLRPTER